MASVNLNNLTKKWGDFIAVDDFNLKILDKEFIVLLGPSGCGKTTTMRMIAGLEEITQGDVFINEIKVNDLEPKDRDIAMVFQSYGLYPNMNVFENIRFPLKVRKVDQSTHEKRVMKAASMVELTDFLHRKPAALSGGQRQRVALARAIVREPNLFLMDEPLSNLDAKLRVSTRAQIKHLHHQLKVTTIYVTHDQVEAMTLADRVVVMNEGVIQQVGSPSKIYNQPKNVFVAGFIGNPAMNLITGQLAKGVFKSENIVVKGLKGPDGPIKLGFRAEDALVISENSSKRNSEITAQVYTSELLGDSTMLTIKVGQEMVIVKAHKDYKAKIGEVVKISIPQKVCHLFDAKSGNNLQDT
tara:strand:- start:4343 stop:5410 length:1068 start_codon:yes stop_codon:yes gene_type:complete